MKVVMMVTLDKYELPLAVADSPAELARMVGTTANTICSAIYHCRKHGRRCRFVRVEIGEEDEG